MSPGIKPDYLQSDSDHSDDDDQFEDIDSDDFNTDDDSDLESEPEEEEGDNEEEEEDEKVKVPKSIRTKGMLADISCHPSEEYLMAAATFQGIKSSYVEVYKCTPGANADQLLKIKASRDCPRGVTFSQDGSSIYYLGKDKTMKIIDTNTGEITRTFHQVHKNPPNCFSMVDENLIATGDEDGTLKVWDLRRSESDAVFSDRKFEDMEINSIVVDNDGRMIHALSQGSIATYNARQRKFVVQSAEDDEQFDNICGATMKNNKKLVVGTDEGIIHIYNRGEFAAPSDSFVASSGASIDSIAKVNDDILFAACDDGYVRAMSILPNRMMSKVGRHRNLAPAKVVSTYDEKFVASAANDGLIKFWNCAPVTETETSNHEKTKKTWKMEKKLNQHRGSAKAKKRKQQAVDAVDPAKRQMRSEFFSSLDSGMKIQAAGSSSDEDSDDDDDDDKEEDVQGDLKPTTSKF